MDRPKRRHAEARGAVVRERGEMESGAALGPTKLGPSWTAAMRVTAEEGREGGLGGGGVG